MKKRFRFYLPTSKSPTYFNISQVLRDQHWQSTRFAFRSHFNEQHFQFDVDAANQLEFKHLLAQLATRYCPHIMPLTYCINDQNWPQILNQIAKNQHQELTWILKPALLNNGRQIQIFTQLDQIEKHYLQSNRLGGEHVLQQYLIEPHLLKGHKYSIRMFVVLTNYAGSYLYPNGYFNVALSPYQTANFNDLRAHLTNEHLQTDESNVVQIPTQRFDFFSSIYQSIKRIIHTSLTNLQKMHPKAFICEKQRALAIFGFDFMVDNDKQVWLLEANHGPCFPILSHHPLQKYLYQDFWQHFTSSFVLPIAKQLSCQNIPYEAFESI